MMESMVVIWLEFRNLVMQDTVMTMFTDWVI